MNSKRMCPLLIGTYETWQFSVGWLLMKLLKLLQERTVVTPFSRDNCSKRSSHMLSELKIIFILYKHEGYPSGWTVALVRGDSGPSILTISCSAIHTKLSELHDPVSVSSRVKGQQIYAEKTKMGHPATVWDSKVATESVATTMDVAMTVALASMWKIKEDFDFGTGEKGGIWVRKHNQALKT
ncbi:hypothetical protein L1987_78316 [Smallanthus sonchifolius]|uniref:Uncharacterized protein n=1 Tax=Smallanthus sonchifolius TaxID=185202 RepID=A0ACB8ZDD6_9ASTR|nr:hypothetical protein L1987_78316 [Smallanthus sonchifolius]